MKLLYPHYSGWDDDDYWMIRKMIGGSLFAIWDGYEHFLKVILTCILQLENVWGILGCTLIYSWPSNLNNGNVNLDHRPGEVQ